MRAASVALTVLLPWLAACESTVVLGTDCPGLRGVCKKVDSGTDAEDEDSGAHDAGVRRPAGDEPDAAAQPDAASERDAAREPADAKPDAPAQELDAEPDGAAADAAQLELDAQPELDAPEVDAQPELDAQLDADQQPAAPAQFPGLQNGSFELRDGASEGPLAPLEMPSAIPPWYACRSGLSALSAARADASDIAPREGAAFLGDSFPNTVLNITGLSQDLGAPLKTGQRYAFLVDLWADSVAGQLELVVASGASFCVPPTVSVLASSGPIPNGGWVQRCISFTPNHDVTTLVLMVGAGEELLNFSAHLYVDNIRSGPDCP